MRPCSKLTYFQTKKNISTLTWSVCQFAYGYFIFCLNLHAGLYYTMCPTRLLLHAIWFSSLMAYFFKSVLMYCMQQMFQTDSNPYRRGFWIDNYTQWRYKQQYDTPICSIFLLFPRCFVVYVQDLFLICRPLLETCLAIPQHACLLLGDSSPKTLV